jgi:signal transduction histidine kinase
MIDCPNGDGPGRLRVLIVEDSPDDAALLLRELQGGRWEVIYERVDTPQAMTAALNAHSWDLIIADHAMPCFSGPAALALAREGSADIPFILISGEVGEEAAVQAMQAGADDYLFKGNLRRLLPAIHRELHDAQGRRKAEYTDRQLQKGERQLGAAQRLAHLGTWHVDLRTSLAVWSDEAKRILGCQSEETLTFQQFLGFLPADDRLSINAALDARDQVLIALDCRIACPNPAAQFVHVRGEIIRDINGLPIEAAGMIQDITERRVVDAQLQLAKAAAEAASLAKSEFLANMSHEIRTPMAAIVGFAARLMHKNEGDAARIEWGGIIQRNALHLLELINEILDLSKIEAGQMKVECIPCDLPVLLSEVISIMRPRAVEKGLEFGVTFQGPIARVIQSDPGRLRQILTNLLGNALKFTEAGKIDIRITEEEVGGPTIALRVDVIDTGIGMPPEVLERLFRPFTQGDESITRKFGGTGLGLTISRQFAKLLGGDITVTSQPQLGSTFTMRIKAGSSAGVERLESLPEVLLPTGVGPRMRAEIHLRGHLLLAEDGADNQRLLRMQLTGAGATVVSALNGKIAIELALAQKFDLILMDMQMPVMDGYAATMELRRKGVKIPIIALTAHAMAEDRDKCLACGCNAYLTKPADEEKLLAAVNHQLGNNGSPVPGNSSGTSGARPPAPASEGSGRIMSSLAGDPRMLAILPGFVDGLPGQVHKMLDLLEHQDLAALQKVVHDLLGTAGGYGFAPVSQPARRAQESIRAGGALEPITADIKSLIEVIRRIEGYDESKPQVAEEEFVK